MADHVVITMGREYCSGGLPIAHKLAEKLGIPCYDKELITIAAKESGLSEEAIAAGEKRRTSSLLYSLYTMGNTLPLADQVYITQSDIIKKLAEDGPCIIVGRCGDYVLRERKHVLRTFVYAPDEYRCQYARGFEENISDKDLEAKLQKEDRNRASYYNYYTSQRWGEARNYDLCLNAAIGEDECLLLLEQAYRAMEAKL